MRRYLDAVVGGAVGVIVMLLLLVLLETETRSAIEVFPVIARYVGTPETVTIGVAFLLIVGAFVWPVLFVLLEPAIPRGPDPAARGVVFATVLWIVFFVVGRREIDGALLIVFAAYSLFAHWAYGFILGAIYGRLADRERSARQEAP
jgi:hypothetical protein